MPNYNRIILAGNLTRDVRIVTAQSGTAIGDFGIAVNRTYKGQQETMFIDCTCFGKTAEILAEYASKGSPVLVEGRLTLDKWEGKDGKTHSKHKVIVDNFQFLGLRLAGSPSGPPAPSEPPAQEDIPF